MRLTVDDQWMMAYMNTRIHNWGDVRDGATRAMKKIENHDDFVAWSDHFLPKSRKDEVKRALAAFKVARAKQKPASKPNDLKKVPVQLDERAARLLLARAKAEQCSVSEYLLKKLA